MRKQTIKSVKSTVSKPEVKPIQWGYETHELPGRTVTIVSLFVPHVTKINNDSSIGFRQTVRAVRGVSIRNPHDCPLPHDGIKFALTRAMERAKLTKGKRKVLWQDFLSRFPTPQTKKLVTNKMKHAWDKEYKENLKIGPAYAKLVKSLAEVVRAKDDLS